MSSKAKIAANQANAKLSTGPTSGTGKAKSSLNNQDEAAVLSEPKTQKVTGLTGRTVLLPADNASAFEQHVAAYVAEYQPQGLREKELVQSLAETRWRLNRIFPLECALLARAPELEDGAVPTQLDAYLLHEKTLRNLHLQENRLNRRFDKDLAELRELQQKRRVEQTASAGNESLDAAAQVYIIAVQTGCLDSFEPRALGFEFSIEQVKRRALQLSPQLFSPTQHAA